MYICDRLAERERVILVTNFVAIRYRVSTVYRVREISLFLKNGYPVTGYWYQVRAMYKSLPLNLSRE